MNAPKLNPHQPAPPQLCDFDWVDGFGEHQCRDYHIFPAVNGLPTWIHHRCRCDAEKFVKTIHPDTPTVMAPSAASPDSAETPQE